MPESMLHPDASAAREAEDLDETIDDAWAALEHRAFFQTEPRSASKATRPTPRPPASPPSSRSLDLGLSAPHHAPPKVGRNDPCLYGSGKKFKKCCGA